MKQTDPQSVSAINRASSWSAARCSRGAPPSPPAGGGRSSRSSGRGRAARPYGAESTAEQVVEGIDPRARRRWSRERTPGSATRHARPGPPAGRTSFCARRTMEKAEQACPGSRAPPRPWPSRPSRTSRPSSRGTDAVIGARMPIDMLILNAGINALPQLEQVYGWRSSSSPITWATSSSATAAAPGSGGAQAGVVSHQQRLPVGARGRGSSSTTSRRGGLQPQQDVRQSKLPNHLYVGQLAKNLARHHHHGKLGHRA